MPRTISLYVAVFLLLAHPPLSHQHVGWSLVPHFSPPPLLFWSGRGLSTRHLGDDGKRSSPDLLHSSDGGADRGGVPARADELVPRGSLGCQGETVRARRVARWTDLSTTVRSLPRRSFPPLLCPQAQRHLGTRGGVRRPVEAPLAHRAPRLPDVWHVDAWLLLHRG